MLSLDMVLCKLTGTDLQISILVQLSKKGKGRKIRESLRIKTFPKLQNSLDITFSIRLMKGLQVK